MDVINTEMNFLFAGLKNIKKEIEVLETISDKKPIENYLNNLINFAGDAIEEMELMGKLQDEVKTIFGELAEKLGEKKTAKIKEILEPIYNFFKTFV